MNTTQRTSIIDPRILSSWREQITQTTVPRIKQQLVQQEQTLLPRFAVYYDTLQHMPRRMRRSLQRQWKQSLAGVALLLTLGQAPALAETIDVDGGCTLIDAITAANDDADTGSCPAGSGADTLVLPQNSLQILTTVNNVSHGPNGLPVIFSDITINGQGSTISRSSGVGVPAFRIFEVYSSYSGTGSLTLQRTTVSGGTTAGSRLASFGGGIALFQQYGYADVSLVLSNSTITGNAASIGGGIGSYGSGGAVRVTITDSTVSNNLGTRGGGLGIVGDRFSSSDITVIDSTVAGNTAFLGGGAFFERSAASISSSTLSGNSVSGMGGAVFNSRGPLNLTESTVTGNTANQSGGGISNDLGSRYSPPGTTTLTRSIVSGNIAPSGPEIYNTIDSDGYYPAGRVIRTNVNILGQNGNAGVMNNFALAAGDIVPSGPVSSVLDTTLANNGGPTQTHALVTGSPAVDTAGGTCLATDQRGIPRPQGPACDIGAFELAVTPLPTTCNGVAITIFGTNGDDVITGTPGRDVIHALAGNDQVSSLPGNDVLCGGEGNDRLFGGVGLDRLEGDGGADQLFGGDQNDVIVGGLDNDQLNGGLGNDIVVGSEGNDTLLGNDGNDRLFGEVGDDRLFGGAGDDLLNGGLNTDYCDGQTGGGDSASACETTLNVE